MSSSQEFYQDILKLDNLSDPYQRNYFYTHLNQLNKVFLATKALLGEDNFNFFANLYVRSLRSLEANMDCYGREFPDFLSGRDELSEMPYIKSLAEIDFYWFEMPKSSIKVEKGMLKFWGHIVNGYDLGQVEINADSLEEISIEILEDSYSLKAKS